MKFIEWLFIVLIFSLPFGMVFRLTIAPNVHIYPFDLIAGSIFIFSLISFFGRKYIKDKKLFILNIAFVGIGFFSLLFALSYLNLHSFMVSLGYLFRYLSYSSIIFILANTRREFIDKISAKLILAGLIFILFGFIQYVYYPNLRNLYYLGWDEHLGRLFSTFLDPNFAGCLLALVFLLSGGIFFEGYARDKKIEVISGTCALLSLIALFLTYSRSAFIQVLVGGIVFLILQKLYRHALVFILILITLLFIFSDFSVEGSNPLRVASGLARVESARDAITIIQKNPIIGVGFNAYRFAQVKYGVREKITGFSNADAGTDNSYLFVLATTGVFGFIFFIEFWINTLKRIYFAPIVFASAFSLLVNTLFNNSIFYSPIMAWIFILIGVTLSRKR